MIRVNWKVVSMGVSLLVTGLTFVASIVDGKAREDEMRNEIQKVLTEMTKGES